MDTGRMLWPGLSSPRRVCENEGAPSGTEPRLQLLPHVGAPLFPHRSHEKSCFSGTHVELRPVYSYAPARLCLSPKELVGTGRNGGWGDDKDSGLSPIL